MPARPKLARPFQRSASQIGAICCPACPPARLQSGQAKGDSPYCSLPSLVGAVCVADAMSRVRGQPASQSMHACTVMPLLTIRTGPCLPSTCKHLQQRAAGRCRGLMSTTPPHSSTHPPTMLPACLPADEWVRGVQRPLCLRRQGAALVLTAPQGCLDPRSSSRLNALLLPDRSCGCGAAWRSCLPCHAYSLRSPSCPITAAAAAAAASLQVQQCLSPGVPPAVPTTFGTKADVDVSPLPLRTLPPPLLRMLPPPLLLLCMLRCLNALCLNGHPVLVAVPARLLWPWPAEHPDLPRISQPASCLPDRLPACPPQAPCPCACTACTALPALPACPPAGHLHQPLDGRLPGLLLRGQDQLCKVPGGPQCPLQALHL